MPKFLTSESTEIVRIALAEALDLLDFGIVLLSPDMRPRFLNRHVIEMWALPADLPRPDMSFRQLLDHVADHCVHNMPSAALPAYIDKLETGVRLGSITSSSFDLIDGRRILLNCLATEDNSRMLTFSDITGLKAEQELRQRALDAAERMEVELRFSNETLESQAAYLASLAEAAADAAQSADMARRQLEKEMGERLELEEQLRRLATTDALTGALNRSQVLALGQHELERTRAVGQGLAVLMLDVDHFKAINDGHGHATGDAALRHLVDQLSALVRRGDLVGRLGGEEFVMILPSVPESAALQAAERVRAQIAGSVIEQDGAAIRLTVSIGIAMARESDRTLVQVLARADTALYAAKRAGRNRVVTSEGTAAAA